MSKQFYERSLKDHHFCSIKDGVIVVTGEIVGVEGTNAYLARFDVPGGASYVRVVDGGIINTLAFFPTHKVLGDFIDAWHKRSSPPPGAVLPDDDDDDEDGDSELLDDDEGIKVYVERPISGEDIDNPAVA